MRPRTWCGVCLALSVAATAASQTRAQNMQRCGSPDPMTRFDGCLALLTSETDLRLLVPAHVNRGTAALELGQDDVALVSFSQALIEAPSHVDVYIYRAIGYARKRQFDKALADCNQALRRGARVPGLYTARGFVYLSLGLPDKALADYDKALEVDAKDSFAWYRRACLLSEQEQYDRAIADFDHYIRLEPNDPRGFLGRAAARVNVGQPESAIADYDRALGLKPDTGAFGDRGLAYQLWSELEPPAADLNTIIKLKPTRPEALLARGLSKFLAGNLAGAAADARSFIDSSPSSNPSFPVRRTLGTCRTTAPRAGRRRGTRRTHGQARSHAVARARAAVLPGPDDRRGLALGRRGSRCRGGQSPGVRSGPLCG